MSNTPDASAGPSTLTVTRQRRRRAAVFVIAAASFLLWPMVLGELAPLRLDTLRLGGVGEARAGAGHGGAHRARAARPIISAQAAIPALQPLGLLGASTPTLLGDLRNLPPAESALSADLPAFGALASATASFNPPSAPSGPDGPAFVAAPSGPPSSPPPPVVSQPPIDPAVTPPDNPVTTQGPSGPPPFIPPSLIDAGGGPGPFKPLAPDPGGPGGGDGPRNGAPVSGIPEPGVWLEVVLGAGLAGAVLRRVRAQPATALRARSRA